MHCATFAAVIVFSFLLFNAQQSLTPGTVMSGALQTDSQIFCLL